MTTYSLDGIEGELFDENDWSDAIEVDNFGKDWDDLQNEPPLDEQEYE